MRNFVKLNPHKRAKLFCHLLMKVNHVIVANFTSAKIKFSRNFPNLQYVLKDGRTDLPREATWMRWIASREGSVTVLTCISKHIAICFFHSRGPLWIRA